MPIYDGVVTVAGDQIPLMVVFDGDSVRLSTSGTEIGEWPVDEFTISHIGDTTFELTADSETLRFVPSQPSLFASEVNGDLIDLAPEPAVDDKTVDRDDAPRPQIADPTVESKKILEAPPPKKVTMALFYSLCALTGGLALWSIIAIVFG